MFENSSEELASHKLLILYILDKINMDLTNSQITQVVLETEMMNYFSLQQFLSQLMESKFLTTYKESDREYYSLTQKGLEILEYFLSRIPEDVTNKIDSSEKQAQQICNNWKNNASYMYAEIIDLLIKENH